MPSNSRYRRQVMSRKWKHGLAGTWVPPFRVISLGVPTRKASGRYTVCRTSPVAPAVPMAKRYFPGTT
jgi:hypothetical protein